jgi:hypothetical protein
VIKIRSLALAATLTVLAGCAATGSDPAPAPAAGSSAAAPAPGSPAAVPPRGEESATAVPTPTEPSTPPSSPTDEIKPAEVIVGTVNRGGPGPCYGLITDDGVQYALYEDKGRTLTKGVRVTVDASPARLRIDCGSGTAVEVKTLTRLR